MRVITVIRKPLSEGNVAKNCVKHGTGALNIDGCRVDAPEGRPLRVGDFKDTRNSTYAGRMNGTLQGGSKAAGETRLGRWPANLIHDGSDEVVGKFPATASGMMKAGQQRKASKGLGGYHDGFPDTASVAGTHGDSGLAARFFKQVGGKS